MDVIDAFNELISQEEMNKNNVEVINMMMRMLKDPYFKNDFIGPKKTYLPIEGYPFKLFMERLCFEDGFYRSILKTSWKNPKKIIEPLMYFQNMIEIPQIQNDLGDKYNDIKNGIIKLRERLLQNL